MADVTGDDPELTEQQMQMQAFLGIEQLLRPLDREHKIRTVAAIIILLQLGDDIVQRIDGAP